MGFWPVDSSSVNMYGEKNCQAGSLEMLLPFVVYCRAAATDSSKSVHC